MAGAQKSKKAKPAKAKTSPRALRTEQKRDRALALRVLGTTYAQIAKELGVRRSRAFELVREALRESRKLRDNAADELRELEAAKLDRAERLANAALANAEGEGTKLAALDRLVRISESRRRLDGMDMPSRAEVTGAGGGPLAGVIVLPAGLPPEEWEKAAGKGGKP